MGQCQEEPSRGRADTYVTDLRGELPNEGHKSSAQVDFKPVCGPEVAEMTATYGHMMDAATHHTHIKQLNQDQRYAGDDQTRQNLQHQHSHHYHHHNPHRQHAPTCVASKLVNANLSPRVRHHQVHCTRHKPICNHHHLLNRTSHSDESNAADKSKPIKYSKQNDKSYLLVQYRSPLNSSNHQTPQNNSSFNNGYREPRDDPLNADYPSDKCNVSSNPSGSKRTTIKFISQLYFLLHLSAILSLLLHHKNLVASRGEATSLRYTTVMGDSSRVAETRRSVGPFRDSSYEAASSPSPVSTVSSTAPTTSSPAVVGDPLPEPQMLNTGAQHASEHLDDPRLRPRQASEAASGMGPQVLNNNTDILVRLVGYWHARCAILYFLCYLLSSSVTMLIGIRLLRFCGWHSCCSAETQLQPEANLDTCEASTAYGFYYRTRLDCTPVLIGSISLGLIQLIVIGLEIASKVHWLSDGRWPIYLPFLQFAFVSLLMQYILGQVAKNHKLQRGQKLGLDLVTSRSINRPVYPENNGSSRQRRIGQISNGIENIALAHLLVTHILLWLMKLNSISLFQPIEQHHQNLHGSTQPAHMVNQLPPRSLFPTGVNVETPAATIATFSTDRPSQIAAESTLSSVARRNVITSQSQINRTELESILRKKMQLSQRPSVASEEPRSLDTRLPRLLNNHTGIGLNQSIQVASRKLPEPPIERGDSPSHLRAVNVSLKEVSGSFERSDPLTSVVTQAHRETERQEATSFEPNARSYNQSKVALPKRMTAFRQAKTHHNGNSSSTTTTTTTTTTTAAPKQRARVLISHTDEIVDLTESTGQRSPKVTRVVEPITTERPFPSVEPPTEASSTRVPSTVLISPTNGQLDDEVNQNVEEASVQTAEPGATDAHESEPASGAPTSGEEEPEPELESMLPPVPNYNESEVLPQIESSEQEVPFNDPASSTISLSRNSTKFYEWGYRVPSAQPLVRRQLSSAVELGSRQSEPSFSDYLLPIVHQYHILVVAILLHMWLDSLRRKRDFDSALMFASNLNGQQRTAWLVNANATSGQKSASDGSTSSGRLFAIPVRRTGKSHGRWRPSKHRRSQSMDSLHQRAARSAAHLANESSSSNEASGSSRSGSLRSSSSEQLLWIPSAQIRTSGSQKQSDSPSESSNLSSRHRLIDRKVSASRLVYGQARSSASPQNSVCSVFLGLLIVSGSLIVIMVGIELLSAMTQCLAQLMSIMACLLGLCLLGGSQSSKRAKQQQVREDSQVRQQQQQTGHQQCFHYLFLLAAYFCGLSVALNLNKQASAQQLFTQQVLQFIQRHVTGSPPAPTTTAPSLSGQPSQQHGVDGSSPMPIANYLLYFHSLLALKGLLLVVQVTLQTVLIRASCAPASRQLRQVYTFLMFANLSLWALEICEQQQQQQVQLTDRANSWLHSQQHRQQHNEHQEVVRLITLDGFSRFAASIVTLSHLYHGLVFMQH